MLGNTLYGLSVLLKNPEVGQSEGSYLLHHLPWLVGSLGVLLLHSIVSFRAGRGVLLRDTVLSFREGAAWGRLGSLRLHTIPSKHPGRHQTRR